ncbi:MAG: NAD-dependent epimerase/dehydratase family protein [Candidatus Zixiibacteriota bacterium]|nr:MAG: NAD-dependent epimerase/dehydratase family protein [candidate division Zixibacteria bacterium]
MKKVLLTGATGYVGGRLLPRLTARDCAVRCLVRRPPENPAGNAEYVTGDVLDPGSLSLALDGVRAAYYLIHSMGSVRDFEALDREAAANFARAAAQSRVERIIYLGGLGDDRGPLSPHLRSRQEVGQVLADSGVPVIELRASIVLGAGSLSFELIRSLVERLPVMVTPRWVTVTAQPIAVADLLDYLVAALDLPARGHRIFEIGGSEAVSYGDLMREYARQRGLRRWMIPVPLLTPRLSSLWLRLVAPQYSRVGRRLIDSLRHPTVVRDTEALRVFGVHPRGFKEAVEEALREAAGSEQ